MTLALLLTLSVLSQFPDSGWANTPEDIEDAGTSCADSLLLEEDLGVGWGPLAFRDPAAVEDCDPEEAQLFARDRARSRIQESPRTIPKARRESNRATFSVTGSPDGTTESLLRHTTTRDGWDHRVELREDEPTRFRLGYTGNGWRAVAGEMTDTAFVAWPRGLPRRSLPAGWSAARGTEESPLLLSAPVPQGFAAGVLRPGLKAYALRTWNPVETGDEPPWRPAWNLRHVAAGAALATGPESWTVSLHASETRISRGAADTLSERLVAAGITSPRHGIARGIDLTAALSESDAAMLQSGSESAAWFAAANLERDFTGGARVALTLRQRGEGWVSAWDPAIAADDAYGTNEDEEEGREAGAGEVRASARIPFREPGVRRENGFARAEAWRAWNPTAGTGRHGMRAALGHHAGDALLELSGTHRVSQAASGSVSLYRLAEIEARTEFFPRWRAAAWRAWNGDGPLRTGLFVGAGPRWRTVHASPGFRLEEDAEGHAEGTASLEFRLWLPPAFAGAGSGWSLDAAASLPCNPAPDTRAARWRVTVTAGR